MLDLLVAALLKLPKDREESSRLDSPKEILIMPQELQFREIMVDNNIDIARRPIVSASSRYMLYVLGSI